MSKGVILGIEVVMIIMLISTLFSVKIVSGQLWAAGPGNSRIPNNLKTKSI
jgi:hypothetical protein